MKHLKGLVCLGLVVAGMGPAWAHAADLHEKPPAPLGDPGSWVVSDDYPPSAMEAHEEGYSAFRLDVDVDGRPVNCTITVSSGSPALDQATCNLVTLRARFSPAVDARGRKLAGVYESRVHWMLPKERPAPLPGLLRLSYLVTLEGDVTDCRVEKVEGGVTMAAATAMANRICRSNFSVPPYADEHGAPQARRVTQTFQTEITPVASASAPLAGAVAH